MPREEMQKVTVLLPRSLVQEALETTGEGLTPTIRRGLEKIATARAYEELLKKRGDYRFSIRTDDLRRDRT